VQEKNRKTCVFANFVVLLQLFLIIIMSEVVDHSALYAMYRRWIYMVIAIAASALLFQRPVFDFQEDKGIIYIRSFSMDQHTFYVTQTDLKTGQQEITETMSVNMLYICNKLMLWSCIICLLWFFSRRGRMWIALITALIAGAYYLLMAYYAVKMSDMHYVTLYPHLISALPAVVIEMMILLRHNLIHAGIDEDERAMEALE